MNKSSRIPNFVEKVDVALRLAIAEVIEEHQRLGQPVVVSKDGKVVWLSPAVVSPVASQVRPFARREIANARPLMIDTRAIEERETHAESLSENLTPRPPSLRGKGNSRPSPFRGGAGGGVSG